MNIMNYSTTYTNTTNSNNIFSDLFSTSIEIYIIIAIAIPIIIFLLYLKTCKLSKQIEYLTKQQEYTNDFLINQINQNQQIINILMQTRELPKYEQQQQL